MLDDLGTPKRVVEQALEPKLHLIIHGGNLPATAQALRDLLTTSQRLFDRGVPVRFAKPAEGGPPSAVALTKNNVIMETHQLCQPMRLKSGEYIEVTLPDRVAQMYLDMVGEWNLPPLTGVSMSPLLSDDGGLRTAEGYDAETRLWCCSVPDLTLPSSPSRADAEAGLRLARETFRTFPFSDAARIFDQVRGIEVVDTSKSPGRDESAFLVALMTACCRSSLWLAPGMLLTAPALSGAGSGKGLLVRAICIIAFGVRPQAFTTGNDRQELDKRLAAELIEAQPVLFLDNANGMALRSDTLASVLTERPARVRLLGQTKMTPLNSTAFIAITGNGLSVTEDLARRFIACELDARCEDPESRTFETGFLDRIAVSRADLLAAMLTIWRWGRQNAASVPHGKPLGSFEDWSRWCRDPLIALGCQDPVERIESLKARDPRRQRIMELFAAWWEQHGDRPTTVNDLAEPVRQIADAQGRGRQYLASYVGGLAGTHAAGFVLSRLEMTGKWTRAAYVLKRAEPDNAIGHRGHRGHRGETAELVNTQCAPTASPLTSAAPMTPMTPMPYAIEDDDVAPGREAAV